MLVEKLGVVADFSLEQDGSSGHVGAETLLRE